MLVFFGSVLDPVSSIIMGLAVLPYFAPECLDLYEGGRVLDSDGFLSQLSVELSGIVPEGLVLSEEDRPFCVSPLAWTSCFRDSFVLAVLSWFFMPNFFLILSALVFFTLDPFCSSFIQVKVNHNYFILIYIKLRV